MKELEVAVALQGESRKGRPKYAGRTKSGEVIVYYGAEPISEPIRVTLVPLEYLLRRKMGRKDRK